MKLLQYFVYLLECADGTLYTGYTTDVERRVAEHNAGQGGKGARYTSARLPVQLCYSEVHATRSAAMKREAEIKKLSRGEKLKLCSTERYTSVN